MNKCLVTWCLDEGNRLKNTICFKHYQRFRLTGTYEPTKHLLSRISIDEAVAFCEKCKAFVPIHTGRLSCKLGKSDAGRKERYGIQADEYELLKKNQNGHCGICKKKTKLYVDHDHETNEIRGLLCSKCNLGLGHFSDDCDTLESAIDYLKKGGA